MVEFGAGLLLVLLKGRDFAQGLGKQRYRGSSPVLESAWRDESVLSIHRGNLREMQTIPPRNILVEKVINMNQK